MVVKQNSFKLLMQVVVRVRVVAQVLRRKVVVVLALSLLVVVTGGTETHGGWRC